MLSSKSVPPFFISGLLSIEKTLWKTALKSWLRQS
jgi:hypothetical protein